MKKIQSNFIKDVDKISCVKYINKGKNLIVGTQCGKIIIYDVLGSELKYKKVIKDPELEDPSNKDGSIEEIIVDSKNKEFYSINIKGQIIRWSEDKLERSEGVNEFRANTFFSANYETCFCAHKDSWYILNSAPNGNQIQRISKTGVIEECEIGRGKDVGSIKELDRSTVLLVNDSFIKMELWNTRRVSNSFLKLV